MHKFLLTRRTVRLAIAELHNWIYWLVNTHFLPSELSFFAWRVVHFAWQNILSPGDLGWQASLNSNTLALTLKAIKALFLTQFPCECLKCHLVLRINWWLKHHMKGLLSPVLVRQLLPFLSSSISNQTMSNLQDTYKTQEKGGRKSHLHRVW